MLLKSRCHQSSWKSCKLKSCVSCTLNSQHNSNKSLRNEIFWPRRSSRELFLFHIPQGREHRDRFPDRPGTFLTSHSLLTPCWLPTVCQWADKTRLGRFWLPGASTHHSWLLPAAEGEKVIIFEISKLCVVRLGFLNCSVLSYHNK